LPNKLNLSAKHNIIIINELVAQNRKQTESVTTIDSGKSIESKSFNIN